MKNDELMRMGYFLALLAGVYGAEFGYLSHLLFDATSQERLPKY